MILWITQDKSTKIDRVCPLCHTYGLNINLYDAINVEKGVNITVATCCTCKGLYHIDGEITPKG